MKHSALAWCFLAGSVGGGSLLAAEGAASAAELARQIDAHVSQERFKGAAWGVQVIARESGRTVFEHDPERLLSPASNAKLYVAALALDRLGGDYRIMTPIMATAKPDAAGLLAGDLVISGRGDPSWHSGAQRERFDDILEPFVKAIADAGVRRVTGDVVADGTFFRGLPHGAGWTVDDLNEYYGAEISALSIEDNYADLRVAPGARENGGAVVTIRQPETGLQVDNRVKTVARDAPRRIEVRRLPGENVVHLFGEIPLGSAPFATEATVPNPGAWFARALKAALVRRGIPMDGGARGVRWPDHPPEGRRWVQLGDVVSPPLRDLVGGFMKPSQNLQTDLLFAHLGEMSRTGATPAWRTSEACALAALQEFLASNRLQAGDVRFDEGSGLSRNDLTSARATVALLQFMTQHREARAFRESLPVAAIDGTLRRRMKGTPAEGRVRAKTGTLRWASSLAGYVTTAAGEELVFCVMLNRAVPAAGRTAREDVDAVAEMLARCGAYVGRDATP